ncbi:MAG TPA: glycosyltransferase 87 family protein [Candidatus Dormibacteraeota bacterium]
MAPPRRTARIVIAVSAALLVAYAIVFAQLSRVDIGRSDFSAFYVGGMLLRGGHAASLYDESLQAPLHARLIAPDAEGNLPFVDPPVAAALVAPVTLLGLDGAYRVWALVELAALVVAVAVAVRGVPRGDALPAGAAALAGTGTLFAVAQAQWTPLLALGLAVAFHTWRRRAGPESWAAALGAAALLAAAAIGKPQLALGLVAFLLGWRRRGLLLGAATAVGGVAVLSLALVGPAGIAGFLRIVAGSTTRSDPHLMVGASGLAAAFAGAGAPVALLTAVIALTACMTAFVLGTRVRRDPAQLPAALAGAAALSLLASPHAYLDDFTMLAPAAAWSLAAAAATGSWRRFVAVLGLWAALSGAAVADLAGGGRLPTGPPTAYVLAAMGLVALASTGTTAAWRVRYRARGEAALGAVADGVRNG